MRDWDNVRHILLEVERVTNELKWDEHRPTIREFYMSALGTMPHRAKDGDFEVLRSKYVMVGKPSEPYDPDSVLGLTYEGHDMLDAIRDDGVWAEIKRIADENGVFLTDELVLKLSKHVQLGKIAEK